MRHFSGAIWLLGTLVILTGEVSARTASSAERVLATEAKYPIKEPDTVSVTYKYLCNGSVVEVNTRSTRTSSIVIGIAMGRTRLAVTEMSKINAEIAAMSGIDYISVACRANGEVSASFWKHSKGRSEPESFHWTLFPAKR